MALRDTRTKTYTWIWDLKKTKQKKKKPQKTENKGRGYVNDCILSCFNRFLLLLRVYITNASELTQTQTLMGDVNIGCNGYKEQKIIAPQLDIIRNF